jgi:hypothetical protein
MGARGAANDRFVAMEASTGMGRVGLAQGLSALQTAARSGGAAVIGVFTVKWNRYLGGERVVPSFLSAFTPKDRVGSRTSSSKEQGAEKVRSECRTRTLIGGGVALSALDLLLQERRDAA